MIIEDKEVFFLYDTYKFTEIEIDEHDINYEDDPTLPELTGGERRNLDNLLIKASQKDIEAAAEAWAADQYAGKEYFANM